MGQYKHTNINLTAGIGSDWWICHVLKKYVSPTIIISYNDFEHDCALRCVYKYVQLAVRLLADASWPRLWLSTYTLIYIQYIDEASTTHTSNFQPIACDRWPPYVLLSDRSASSLRAVRFWPVLCTGYCREGPFLSGCVFWRLLSRPC